MSNQSPEQKYYIPQKLDEPPKFLWWDFDVAILAMGCVMFGIVLNQTLTFMVVGLIFAGLYQKLKAGRSRAFGLHFLYWYFGANFGFRATPPSAVREFIG